MTETQLAEENQEAQPLPETQTTEEKFLGVKSTVGTDKDSNIEIEVVDDRPEEDRKPPKKESKDKNSQEIEEFSDFDNFWNQEGVFEKMTDLAEDNSYSQRDFLAESKNNYPNINVDFNEFENHTFFGSAKKKLENF